MSTRSKQAAHFDNTATTQWRDDNETIKQQRSARVQCTTKQRGLDDSIDQCAATSIALYALSTGDSGEPYPHL